MKILSAFLTLLCHHLPVVFRGWLSFADNFDLVIIPPFDVNDGFASRTEPDLQYFFFICACKRLAEKSFVCVEVEKMDDICTPFKSVFSYITYLSKCSDSVHRDILFRRGQDKHSSVYQQT